MKIYYYHPLDLTFKSAQTIQVIKDYCHLSKIGTTVVVYGTYKNESDFLLIQKYISNSGLKIISRKFTSFGKFVTKVVFFWDILRFLEKKIIITRHYRKLSNAFFLKKIIPNVRIIHEMHEESFPYLFKSHIKKEYINSLFLNKFLDCLIFTNYSQELFFKQEFGRNPRGYIVLPNGVEVERFRKVTMLDNFVLTYLGQFNRWKNVELIFQSLSLLDEKYTLRIAGGKGGVKDENYIKDLVKKYNINPSRVNYLGFVDNHEVASKVLKHSNILLLPLGDNIQSRFLTSPMKLFEYMATSIPILSVDYPSVRLIATDKIFFSLNNAKDFSRKIMDICDKNKDDFNFDSANTLAQHYSYKNRSKRFQEIINDI